MSRAQQFDTTLFRLVDNEGPGVATTLAAIYAFGLADNPVADNVFNALTGPLSFPGYQDYGGGRMATLMQYFQDKTEINLFAPPGYELVSLVFQNNGVGGNGCGAFRIDELRDTNWDGVFGHLSGQMQWITEQVTVSNDPNTGENHTAGIAAETTYDPNATSSFVPGGGGLVPFAMERKGQLFNDLTGSLLEVENLTGYGMLERLVYAVQNGGTAQWVTHYQNHALTPAAGDGPAWWVDTDGRFGRFLPAAGVQPYQTTSDPAEAWGVILWARDSSLVLQKALDVDTTRGLLNGAPIATIDSGAFPVEAFESAEIDLTALGTTQLVPAKLGKTFIPQTLSIRTTAVAGAISTGPTVAYQYNGLAGGFILGAGPTTIPSSTMFATGLGALNQRQPVGASAGVPSADNTAINVQVTVGATGTGGFAWKVKIQITGFYR